jgi:hypothetical protein
MNELANHFFIVAVLAVNRVLVVKGFDALRNVKHGAIVFDVTNALASFNRMFTDRQRKFTTMDIAEISGMALNTIATWIGLGVLWASEPGRVGRGGTALFSYREAFACGVLGSLSRNGATNSILKRVYRLLVTAGTEEEAAVESKEECVV